MCYCACNYKQPKQKQPGYKKVRGQSEARLQATKTSDIKEGQDIIIFPFTEMIYILQDIFTTTIDFVTWSPFCTIWYCS